MIESITSFWRLSEINFFVSFQDITADIFSIPDDNENCLFIESGSGYPTEIKNTLIF